MFDQVYALTESEVIRRVRPPFIAERMDYYRRERPSQAESMPQGPDAMMFLWRNGKADADGCFFGHQPDGGRGYSAQQLIEYLLKVYRQDLEGNAHLAGMAMPGDFVVRAGANAEEYRVAIERIVAEASGGPVALTFREVQRPAIVFTGTWQAKNPNRKPNDLRPIRIEIYGARMGDPGVGGGGTGSITDFAGWVGSWIEKSVLIEATGLPAKLSWHYHDPGDGSDESRRQAHDPELVCMHIREQTGLNWKEEIREITRLFIERAN